MTSNDKEFLATWNSLFPLDYWWRKKYNISFNSRKHREISYIDIFYEWLEEKMFEEHFEELGKEESKRSHYQKTGEWFKIEITEEKEKELVDMFDKMDVAGFNEVSEEG